MFIGSKPKDLFPRQNKAAADFYRRQQQKKIHAKGPYLAQRSFRRNEGTTDGYETNARLIPNPLAHFDVEFQLLGDADIAGTFVSQNVSSTSSAREFQIFQNNQPVQVILGGAINALATTLTAGVWRIKFDGVGIQVIKDGAVIETFTPSIGSLSEPSATFTMCMRHDGTNSTYGFHYEGVMANVVIRNTSDQITNDYPLDDNSDILRNRATVLGGELWVDGDALSFGESSYVNSIAHIVSTGADSGVRILGVLDVGTTYKVDVEVFDYISGSVRVGDGGGIDNIYNANGFYTAVFTADQVTALINRNVAGTDLKVRLISYRQADGYGTVINGNASDWGLFQQQATGEWLGQELITQSAWENPFSVGSEWSFSNNQWTLTGTGVLSSLTLLQTTDQPEVQRLVTDIESISGAALAVTDGVAAALEKTVAGIYTDDIDKATYTRQLYKRNGGATTTTINKPSMKEVLNVA